MGRTASVKINKNTSKAIKIYNDITFFTAVRHIKYKIQKNVQISASKFPILRHVF
jgi:hypothetical protein